MMSSDKVCHPKHMGGLGLRKTEATNKFYCKIFWKYLTKPNNFWAKVISAKCPLALGFFTCTNKSNDSWI